MKDIYLMNKETGELVPSADVFATYRYTSYLSSPFDEWLETDIAVEGTDVCPPDFSKVFR